MSWGRRSASRCKQQEEQTMAGGVMRRQLGHLGFELRAVLSHELVQCFVGLGRRLLAC